MCSSTRLILRIAVLAGLLPAFAGFAFDGKTTPTTIAPRQPLLASVFPMGVTIGQSADIEVIGEYLDGVTSLSSDCEELTWTIAEASAIALNIRVQASSSATPGPCFLYAQGSRGVSNRLLFRVTAWKTAIEQEPNDSLEEASPIEVPSIIHGRLARINDSDFFRVNAAQGQRLAFSVLNARNGLNGHLALTLLDARGKEVAHNHYGFGPDPYLDHTFAQSGAYVLVVTSRRSGDFFTVISDSGILNWQYQIAVGQSPVPRSIFPLGGKRGSSLEAELKADFIDPASQPQFSGKGVSAKLVSLDDRCKCRFKMAIDIAADATPGEHFLSFADPSGNTVFLSFFASDDTEIKEKEPNDREETAQEISLPLTINGRVAEPGDHDNFRIKVNQDDDLTFSVMARGLGSQMTDPYLAVSRAGGDLVGVGDDRCQQFLGKDEACPAYFSSIGRKEKLDPEASHRFVSRSANDADAAGEYIIRISDNSVRGSEENAYRLTVRKRSPDFRIGMNASRVSAPTGGRAKVPVVVLRREGFRGKIEVTAQILPAGWTASPLTLESDQETGTLEIVQDRPEPFTSSVELTGSATVGGVKVAHVALLPPFLAEDGFGYIEPLATRLPVSFVPAALYSIAVESPKGGAILDLAKAGTVELLVNITRADGFKAPVGFTGEALPPGISLQPFEAAAAEKIHVVLAADPGKAKPGNYRIALRGVADVDGRRIFDVSQSFRIEVRQ